MVFISCAATALRKRPMKASKSASVASWPGFTFAGFFSWAGFFLGGGVPQAAARPNLSKTKAKNLTPAFIGDTFVSVFWEWQVHPYALSLTRSQAPASLTQQSWLWDQRASCPFEVRFLA